MPSLLRSSSYRRNFLHSSWTPFPRTLTTSSQWPDCSTKTKTLNFHLWTDPYAFPRPDRPTDDDGSIENSVRLRYPQHIINNHNHFELGRVEPDRAKPGQASSEKDTSRKFCPLTHHRPPPPPHWPSADQHTMAGCWGRPTSKPQICANSPASQVKISSHIQHPASSQPAAVAADMKQRRGAEKILFFGDALEIRGIEERSSEGKFTAIFGGALWEWSRIIEAYLRARTQRSCYIEEYHDVPPDSSVNWKLFYSPADWDIRPLIQN